jgi:cytolysin (calcineurin-like family phosphatase)
MTIGSLTLFGVFYEIIISADAYRMCNLDIFIATTTGKSSRKVMSDRISEFCQEVGQQNKREKKATLNRQQGFRTQF